MEGGGGGGWAQCYWKEVTFILVIYFIILKHPLITLTTVLRNYVLPFSHMQSEMKIL